MSGVMLLCDWFDELVNVFVSAACQRSALKTEL